MLINRNFARLWSAQTISALGDYVFETTLLLWIASVLLAGSPSAPAAVSGVLIAFALATVVVGPAAGVYVDRWDKRRTMMVADLICAGTVGILTFIAFLPEATLSTPVTLTLIYFFVFLTNAVIRFFVPARLTLLGDIVPDDAGRAKASGLIMATDATAMIVGPVLAAPLLFSVGLQWALLLNALSFLGSFLFVRAIRVEPGTVAESAPPAGSFWAQLREGIMAALRSRIIVTMMITVVILTVGTGALNTLDVFFVAENLHTDLSYYGILGAAIGAGVIAGALASGWVSRRLGIIAALNATLVGTGVFMLAYTRMTQFVPAVVLLLLAGTMLGVVNSLFGPLLLKAVPRQVLGRVSSVFNPVQQIASIVGALVAGSVAASLTGLHLTMGPLTFQRVDLILGAAALLFLAGGVYSVFALRRLPQPAPQEEEEEEAAAATPAAEGEAKSVAG